MHIENILVCVTELDLFSLLQLRGYRIELNEIDGKLSQFPLIRFGKTLVRRNKSEEPILVSYIVPELNEWHQFLKANNFEDVDEEGTDIGPTKVYFKRFRRLQTEVREHLKGRLPIYVVPTTYIFLSKLPLNPNGKVDKPNLPFPNIVQQTEDASDEDLKRWESLTETERTIATHCLPHWCDRLIGCLPNQGRLGTHQPRGQADRSRPKCQGSQGCLCPSSPFS